MTSKFEASVRQRDALLPTRPSAEARRLLALRRSTGKMNLGGPGPSKAELNELLRIAARVPDHRALNPWRFIVISGENRRHLGQQMAQFHVGDDADKTKAASLFLRAPVVIAVISSPKDDGRTPKWEQELSAGAVCYNLLLAANAAGWAGCWLSEWICYDPDCHNILGLANGERPAGFIYLGTATQTPQERRRPIMSDIVSYWGDADA